MEAGFKMSSLSPRIKRVLDAISDLSSYRLLWYSLTDRPTPLEGIETDNGPTGEFGMPRDEPVDDRTVIPEIVFQTWKSHHEMPANYRYWRRSFLLTNPGFRCFLWDDNDNRQFIEQRFPWFLGRYNSYPKEIFRADVIRLFFLYVYGGFYADMDSECLRPLEDMREMGDVLVGRMGRDNDFEHSIPNAVMASKAGQAFWLLAIAFASERLAEFHLRKGAQDIRPEWLTGPILLKDVVDFYSSHTTEEVRQRISKALPELEVEIVKCDFGKIRILPPAIWYPVNWNNFMHTVLRKRLFKQNAVVESAKARRLFPQAYIVTYWSASWK
jgi:mannosyltransferase OCH1-like enzyme